MGIYDIRNGQPVEPANDAEVYVEREFIATVGVVGQEDWAYIPVQTVFIDDGLSGWKFRIGQFEFFGSDALHLINDLECFGRLSGDFRPRKAGE